MRTNDPVVVSFARSLLDDAGISVVFADEHISAIEGTIGAFPRRLLVVDEDLADARQLLEEAGLSAWLVTP